MNPLIYNVAILIGVIAASTGASMQFGQGVGLMVFGSLLIALTVVGAYFSAKGAA
jgi:hypothetical protein